LFKKIIALIPWGLRQIHRFAAYAMAVYVIVGTLVALLGNLDHTYVLNIIGGIGLVAAGILIVPAIMSTDSGPSTASSVFIGTVFSYPFVYLFSLFADNLIPGIEKNGDLALAIAALPMINVLVFIGMFAIIMIKE
jgi:hypothetical protein